MGDKDATPITPLELGLIIIGTVVITALTVGLMVDTLAEVRGFEAGQAECWSCHKRHTGNIRPLKIAGAGGEMRKINQKEAVCQER